MPYLNVVELLPCFSGDISLYEKHSLCDFIRESMGIVLVIKLLLAHTQLVRRENEKRTENSQNRRFHHLHAWRNNKKKILLIYVWDFCLRIVNCWWIVGQQTNTPLQCNVCWALGGFWINSIKDQQSIPQSSLCNNNKKNNNLAFLHAGWFVSF